MIRKLSIFLISLFAAFVGHSQSTNTTVVATKVQLKNLVFNDALVFVSDSADRGVYFNCASCIADEITVFLGAGGKKWKKAYDVTVPLPHTHVIADITGLQAALDGKMVDPMTTIGDMIYRNGSNATARLPIGTTNQVLNVSGGGLPFWTSTQRWSGDFPVINTTTVNATLADNQPVMTYLGVGGHTLTLPTTVDGSFLIKNGGSGSVTVQRGGSATIYTSSSVTSFTLDPGQSVFLTGYSSTSIWQTLFASTAAIDTTTIYATLNERPILTTLANLRLQTSPPANAVYYVYDAGTYGFFKYDAADNTSADDTATILVAGTKRFKRQFGQTIYPEWWLAAGDANSGISGTDDAPAFNRMFRWLERQARGSYEIKFQHTDYYIASAIILPATIGTLAGVANPYIFINGEGVTIKTNQAIDIFRRMPANDTEVGTMNANYKLVMKGITLQGDRTTSGQVGTRIACGYGWRFENMHYTGLDTGVVASFMTKSTWTDNFFTVNQKVDIKLQSLNGIVGTQSIAGSACNANTIENSRFFEFAGAHAPVILLGTDQTKIEHFIIEGAQPRYGIYADHQNSSVVNALYINDDWYEGNSASPSVNFRIKGAGLVRINSSQRSYADTLFDFDGSLSGTIIEINGLTYTDNLAAKPFSVGTTNPTFSGNSIIFKNVDPSTASKLTDATKWVGGSVPQNMSIEYFGSANAGYTVSTSSVMNFYPRLGGAGIVDRYFNIEGNLTFITDNQGSIGGQYTTGSNRPRAVHVGTTGVYVDNSGRYYFGKAATTTPDVSIARGAVGRLDILDNSTNYRDLKVRDFEATGNITSATAVIGTSSGIVKSTSGTLGIAIAADFPTLNQTTTGSAASLTTPRSIYGNNFDGTANLAQIIASTFGGTGNGFTKFTGAATAEKTYTLPNSNATILTNLNTSDDVTEGSTNLYYTTARAALKQDALTSSSDVSLNTAVLTDFTTTTPSAPADGTKIFSRQRAGVNTLSAIGERGKAWEYQRAIYNGRIGFLNAQSGAATLDGSGLRQVTSTAATAVTPTFAGNIFAASRRVGLPTTATAGTIGGVRMNQQTWCIGDAAGKGGFMMVVRGGIASFTSDGRGIVGMRGSASAMTNVEASSLTNILGFGYDAADTDWFFMHNDGTGTATKETLGSAGQFPCKTTATDLYEFRIYVPSQGTTVYYSIERLNNGNFVEGTVTTDLPAATTGLAYLINLTNNATASIAQFDICSVYIESEN